jgi:hypothetical protein
VTKSCRFLRRTLVAAMCCAPVLHAQREIPVQAGATIDHDTVTVGQVMVLSVRVRAARGATINFPAAVDSLGPVQALDPPTVKNGSDSVEAEDRIAIYRMAAWDVGPQPIKLGEILIQTDDGDRRITVSLPTVIVKSVLPADTTLRVPKPARPLIAAPAQWPWWWWALAAAAAILVSVLTWWWAKRRHRSDRDTGDPYVDAMAAFERIEKLKLIDAGEPGRHAALMTDVVRHYLAARLDDVSLALTSRELLDAVRGAPTVSHESLRTLFDAVDPIKFARAPLDGARARALGDSAKTIVREEHRRAEDLAAAAAPAGARAA